MKSFVSSSHGRIRRSAYSHLTLLLIVGVSALGCSTVGDTSLSPEGEIGAGDLEGSANGEGSTPGEAGGGDASTCGDGTCDPGENVFTCRADCEAGPFLQCLTEACPALVQACSDTDACAAALICLSACDPEADLDTSEACRGACAANLAESDAESFAAIVACEATSECRPDGPTEVIVPDPVEADPALSCEGRCGEPLQDGAECACDASCAIFGDCCADYEALCVDTPGEDVSECGDGICDADEDAQSCPGDCDTQTTGPCGDGVCGDDESAQSCPEDCAATQDSCGDGACSDEENPQSCPEDCAPTGGPVGVVACLAEACPSEYESCTADDTCVEVLDCIATCPPGDQNCLFGCSQLGGFSMTAINLGLCGQESGCFDADPGPAAECGDGVCQPDAGETSNNCPADCGDPGAPGDGWITDPCAVDYCSPSIEACEDIPGCVETFECINSCQSQGCVNECLSSASEEAITTLEELYGCYDDNCAGGGGTPGQDCVSEECGSELNTCLDDPNCNFLLTCVQECQDDACVQQCAGQAGNEAIVIYNELADCFFANCANEPFCGDGECGPGESPNSCPEDCGAPGGPGGDLEDCLEDNCEDELEACLDDADCVAAYECIQDCPAGDQGCLFQCSQIAGFSGAAINLGLCGQSSGCFEGDAPSCGDGVCGPGENANSCPQDCANDGGECAPGCPDFWIGDDICDAECNVPQCGFDEGDCDVDGPGDDEAVACIVEECNVGNQCQNSSSCFGAIQCIAQCNSEDCVYDCADDMQGGGKNYITNQVAPCAIESACLDLGDAPEPGPTEGFEACLAEECEVQLDTCYSNGSQTCPATFDCAFECTEGGGSVDECLTECWEGNQGWTSGTTTNLYECSLTSGCADSGPPPGPVCGDGVCEPGENCAADCDQPEPLFGCLSEACPAQWEACLSNPVCADALPCLNECVESGGTGCTYQCMPQQENQQILELGQCGGQNGCGNICGDGECDPGETADSCPQDCSNQGGGDTPDDYMSCIEDACVEQYFSCYNNGSQTCPATFDCVDECLASGKEVNECVNGCYELNDGASSNTTTNLYQCSANTCHEASNSPPGGGGQGGGGQGGGDDPTEEILQCLESECESELDACYASDTCPAVLDCAVNCGGDFDCALQCASDSFFDQAVIGIGFCLQSSGCLEAFGG